MSFLTASGLSFGQIISTPFSMATRKLSSPATTAFIPSGRRTMHRCEPENSTFVPPLTALPSTSFGSVSYSSGQQPTSAQPKPHSITATRSQCSRMKRSSWCGTLSVKLART